MKNLQKLLMSLFLSLCILSCFELFAWSQLEDDIYTGDPAYFWKLKPNLNRRIENGPHPFTLRTNADGFRDEEWSNAERWLFLGCSTTLGWGVDYGDGFVRQLDLHFDAVDVMNGGQPGWSTQQVLHNIDEFTSFSPTKVFVGLGVRDAQVSDHADKDAQPSPWIATLHLFRWLKQIQTKSKPKGTEGVGLEKTVHQQSTEHRVSPTDFQSALTVIQRSFPEADVVFYQFPQQNFSPAHSAVLAEMKAWKPEPFEQGDFFPDDPIHLTTVGHQKLADWFVQRLNSDADR